jgi:hypothetical protein
MSLFHEHFKNEFSKIWNDANDVDPDEAGSLEGFLDQAEELYTGLSAHHGIEVRAPALEDIQLIGDH